MFCSDTLSIIFSFVEEKDILNFLSCSSDIYALKDNLHPKIKKRFLVYNINNNNGESSTRINLYDVNIMPEFELFLHSVFMDNDTIVKRIFTKLADFDISKTINLSNTTFEKISKKNFISHALSLSLILEKKNVAKFILDQLTKTNISVRNVSCMKNIFDYVMDCSKPQMINLVIESLPFSNSQILNFILLALKKNSSNTKIVYSLFHVINSKKVSSRQKYILISETKKNGKVEFRLSYPTEEESKIIHIDYYVYWYARSIECIDTMKLIGDNFLVPFQNHDKLTKKITFGNCFMCSKGCPCDSSPKRNNIVLSRISFKTKSRENFVNNFCKELTKKNVELEFSDNFFHNKIYTKNDILFILNCFEKKMEPMLDKYIDDNLKGEELEELEVDENEKEVREYIYFLKLALIHNITISFAGIKMIFYGGDIYDTNISEMYSCDEESYDEEYRYSFLLKTALDIPLTKDQEQKILEIIILFSSQIIVPFLRKKNLKIEKKNYKLFFSKSFSSVIEHVAENGLIQDYDFSIKELKDISEKTINRNYFDGFQVYLWYKIKNEEIDFIGDIFNIIQHSMNLKSFENVLRYKYQRHIFKFSEWMNKFIESINIYQLSYFRYMSFLTTLCIDEIIHISKQKIFDNKNDKQKYFQKITEFFFIGEKDEDVFTNESYLSDEKIIDVMLIDNTHILKYYLDTFSPTIEIEFMIKINKKNYSEEILNTVLEYICSYAVNYVPIVKAEEDIKNDSSFNMKKVNYFMDNK